MKLFSITYYTMLRHLRDYKSIIAFISIPIIMMLILGATLNNEFTPKQIETLQLGYLSDGDEFVDSALQQFLSAEELSTLLHIKEVQDYEQGIEQLRTGDLKGLIYLTRDQAASRAEQAELHYISLREDFMISPILESFVQSFNLQAILLTHNMIPSQHDLDGIGNTKGFIAQMKIVTEGLIPRGIDYYAITTLFQSLIFGALLGTFAITKDYANGTYARLQTTPVQNFSVVLGKYLGSVFILFGISMIILIVMAFGFKANWSGDFWLILLVIFLFTAISTGIGMAVAYLSKSLVISALTIFLLSTIFTLVSGGFSPMEGAAFDLLSRLSPNTYSQNLLFSNIYENDISHSDLSMLIIYTLIVVGMVFGIGRRRAI